MEKNGRSLIGNGAKCKLYGRSRIGKGDNGRSVIANGMSVIVRFNVLFSNLWTAQESTDSLMQCSLWCWYQTVLFKYIMLDFQMSHLYTHLQICYSSNHSVNL